MLPYPQAASQCLVLQQHHHSRNRGRWCRGHESSKHAGDAVCAFNGTGYSIDGKTSHIPETTLCGTWESPLFALGRDCNEGDTPFQTRAGIGRVHVSEPPRVRKGVNALLPSPASFNGRVCSLPYNPWNLGECVDGTAVTAVPVLQVVISDGAGRQGVSASASASAPSGHGVASASPSRTSSITAVSSAVFGASPAASGWPVSSSGATATGAVNVGSGRGLLCDGACWSMLLLVSLRVVAHVLLMLGWV
ncbi:uncharacterized protein NFIA_033780 [Aspergillus fischeri NRRL 181]|uniref:Uncharacterized protein n=1 Tax=Neosartorya fischeri (strain ATCC 1020 / DSM 3700 / CBS 544.65 / FGSC A1164 / JCM 1740 / NRRL 181 / WB 181) TaxID=331117 RepID=A1CYJ2_NEOFI|nr:conserved hypothetical protein [Aspergillus fischeri NRRL 181]EAW23812.1 conserved hypothetical protein [Aspergillus fischeri NRRL 181]